MTPFSMRRTDRPKESGEGASLSTFQETCLAQVEDLLRRKGVEPTFQIVSGEGEIYLKASFEYAQKALEVYIYKDEAGFYEDRKWRICETQDFDSDSQLIEHFLEQLSHAL
jgi:hypothetical protein